MHLSIFVSPFFACKHLGSGGSSVSTRDRAPRLRELADQEDAGGDGMRAAWMPALVIVIAALVAIAPARVARAQSRESTAALSSAAMDLTVRRGTIATLATVCSMRDAHWAEDLRKATIQDATNAPAPDDGTLKSSPSSNQATSALGYAEMEALEKFAEKAPDATCPSLAYNPDLSEGDRRVAAFRRDLAATHPAS
jgi:hypothetical protein